MGPLGAQVSAEIGAVSSASTSVMGDWRAFPCWGKVLQISWGDPITRQLRVPWVLTSLGLMMPPKYSHLLGKHWSIPAYKDARRFSQRQTNVEREIPMYILSLSAQGKCRSETTFLFASLPPLSFRVDEPVILIRGTSVFNISHMEPDSHPSSPPPSQIPLQPFTSHSPPHRFSLLLFRFLEASSREPQQVHACVNKHPFILAMFQALC